MRAADALGQLVEQGHHDLSNGPLVKVSLSLSIRGRQNLLKLCGLYDIQDLLQLIEEHHLLGAVHLGPVPDREG